MTPQIPSPTPLALRAPAATAPAAAARALQRARVSYGTALVLAPGVVIFVATGRQPGRRARRVARLLGARHLAQAALTAVAPRPEVFTTGAQADALHAASMLMLAVSGHAERRTALTDAIAEAAFAATGLAAAAAPAVRVQSITTASLQHCPARLVPPLPGLWSVTPPRARV